MEPHELPPQWWEKFLYLGSMRRAPEGPDREWLRHLLTTSDQPKLRFLATLPQALLLFAFGLFAFGILSDNTLGWVWCVGAPVILVVATFWPWYGNFRIRHIKRKNGFT